MPQSLVIQRRGENGTGLLLRDWERGERGGRKGKIVPNHATLGVLVAPRSKGRIGDTLIKHVLSHRPIRKL